MKRRWGIILLCLASALAVAWILYVPKPRLPVTEAQKILNKTGIKDGLGVHLGTTDGALEIGLANTKKLLVHGLTLDDKSTERARRTIQSMGLYGSASVEKVPSLETLPYADCLAEEHGTKLMGEYDMKQFRKLDMQVDDVVQEVGVRMQKLGSPLNTQEIMFHFKGEAEGEKEVKQILGSMDCAAAKKVIEKMLGELGESKDTNDAGRIDAFQTALYRMRHPLLDSA